MPIGFVSPLHKGFSLLELLIVLVLMALTGGVTAPKLVKLYTRTVERSELQAYAQQIENLRVHVLKSGHSLLLAAGGGANWPPLPTGWEAKALPSLRLLATGITNGGELLLQASSGRLWQLQMAPLDGRVQIRPVNKG
ncbi:MAG: prepilin-type N-terminal cleavage/methylation domain-containing protein [Methylovulum sp.]|nr:prepilin-type N-terminal cleavage/methylation domain-containing protein [Methylovulum sp.]